MMNPPVTRVARARPTKKWWQSRTIQVHAANCLQAAAVLVINFLSTHPDGNVTKVELVALLVSIVTVVLRVLTDQPIAGSPKDPTMPTGGG